VISTIGVNGRNVWPAAAVKPDGLTDEIDGLVPLTVQGSSMAAWMVVKSAEPLGSTWIVRPLAGPASAAKNTKTATTISRFFRPFTILTSRKWLLKPCLAGENR
jgi:hypothetical protein